LFVTIIDQLYRNCGKGCFLFAVKIYKTFFGYNLNMTLQDFNKVIIR